MNICTLCKLFLILPVVLTCSCSGSSNSNVASSVNQVTRQNTAANTPLSTEPATVSAASSPFSSVMTASVAGAAISADPSGHYPRPISAEEASAIVGVPLGAVTSGVTDIVSCYFISDDSRGKQEQLIGTSGITAEDAASVNPNSPGCVGELSSDETLYVQTCTKAVDPPGSTSYGGPAPNGTVAVARTASSGDTGLLLGVGYSGKSSILPTQQDLDRIAVELAGVLSNLD